MVAFETIQDTLYCNNSHVMAKGNVLLPFQSRDLWPVGSQMLMAVGARMLHNFAGIHAVWNTAAARAH